MVRYRREIVNSIKYKKLYQFNGNVYSSCRSERKKVIIIRRKDEKRIERLEYRAFVFD